MQPPDDASPAPHMPEYPPDFPICIDLDGTLVKEHTLWHMHWDCSIQNIRELAVSWPWPRFKSKLAGVSNLSQSQWTYHQPLIDQLQRWHYQGARLYLVTGAPEKIATHVAHRIGLFFDVWSSSSTENLVGHRKADHLRHHFGAYGYTYIGDSWKDCPVWETSKDIISVAPASSLLGRRLKRRALPYQRLFWLPHPQK